MMRSNLRAMLSSVIFTLGLAATDATSESAMKRFYQELGCTPVSSYDNSSYSDAFKCPDLQPEKNKCYYRGAAYEAQTYIPQNLIESPCSLSCICDTRGDKPEINCAAVDCREYFKRYSMQQCIYTYQLGSCCSSGTVCGEEALAKLKQCEVDGKMYYEGQQFYPKNTYKTCVCTPEWDGNVDNSSYCKDINCGLELHYKNNILNNCAPVFFGSDHTCPIYFICLSPTRQVVRGQNSNINAQCMFGNQTLAVGDEIMVEDQSCVKCTCEVPPFVTCIRSKDICD